MAYIFDTNIFVRSKHEMPMDLWPTFWTKIAGMINSGNVFSNIQVKIPDACDALGVRYCDLNTVLRELNITI